MIWIYVHTLTLLKLRLIGGRGGVPPPPSLSVRVGVVSQLSEYVHFLTLLKLKHRKVSNWRGYRGYTSCKQSSSRHSLLFFAKKSG